jgi:hypothetical protein
MDQKQTGNDLATGDRWWDDNDLLRDIAPELYEERDRYRKALEEIANPTMMVIHDSDGPWIDTDRPRKVAEEALSPRTTKSSTQEP